MKTDYYDSDAPKIGDIVYPHCQPVKAGKIVAVGPMRFYGPDSRCPGKPMGLAFSIVTIRQPNGKEHEHQAITVKCFRTLVEEHERKGAKFRATLESINGIPAEKQP